jgi:site-specific recombinase XerD
VNLRVIQEFLGHKSPNTTAIYTHLTHKAVAQLATTINGLMPEQ